MENKGRYIVLLKNNKYGINYIEKGCTRDLSLVDSKYGFDEYDLANDYIKNNKEELNNVVSNVKKEEEKRLLKMLEEEKLLKESKTKKSKKQKVKKVKDVDSSDGFKRFMAALLAAITLLVGGHFIGKGISTAIKESKSISKEQETKPLEIKDANVLEGKFREFLVNKGIIKCDILSNGNIAITVLKNELKISEVKVLANEFFTDELFTSLVGNLDIDVTDLDENSKIEFCREYLVSLGIEVDVLDINNSIVEISTASEELTTEKFTEIVANFARPYVDNGLSLSVEDLTKFNTILLIDRLAEENPQLVEELTSVQTEEEFLNDAAKTIGVTYMYNHNMWETNKNTDKFIWISNGIPMGDPQREKVVLFEEYVKKIADAAKENDKDSVNLIAGELIEELTNPDGKLNALDDGTEFGLQIYIALINNSIARNYLNQEYRDYFNARSTSETNVSNIFAVIRGCNQDSKTKTLS